MKYFQDIKVKIKSLAAEAMIIRAEERKLAKTDPDRISLHFHRKFDVRREARSALLAYGFLRGRSYHNIEPIGSKPANRLRVMQLVAKYGDTKLTNDMITKALREWVELGVPWSKAA